MNFQQAIDTLLEHENACNVCKCSDSCRGGVTGGPNGPIFPPCCDGGYEGCLYEEDAIELAEEIVNDV